MSRLLALILALPALLGAVGCAYRVGPSSGVEPGSRSVVIRPFENATLEPRVTENVANALRAQIQQEGTFRLATHAGEGDLVVTGVIQDITREEQSFQARDTRTLRDYNFELVARVVATERGSGRTIFDREVRGHTMLRIVADLPSAERQAMPLAAANLARNITSMLVDGDW
ncbi:MAG: hypothetical protein JNL97_09875 [Verrucomicrobiales bacterium]|nr:hypothetical protein [Verrucomicrobiales bacterium]